MEFKKGLKLMKVRERRNVYEYFKVGDIVWACAFARTRDANQMLLRQEPILGMLTACNKKKEEQDVQNGNVYKNIFYFVPFKKNCKAYSLDNLAWTRAVRIHSRKYATTEKECVELYNELIDEEINYHENLIDEIKEYYIYI